jgi:membrane-anchored protein YejM (alkaline phosphatase superfamily)
MFSSDNAKLVGIIVLFVSILALAVVWPLVILWSLNCLFPVLAINYGFWQWAAVLVLQTSTFGSISFHLREIAKKL